MRDQFLQTLLGGVLAGWFLLGAAFVARAEEGPAKKDLEDRYVISVDEEHGEIVVDAGRADGLEPGAKVRLFTSVKMKHPITRKTIVDLIPLAVLNALRVGDGLSVLKPQGKHLGRIKVGDVIRFRLAPAIPAEEIQCKVKKCPKCESDPDLKAVHDAWLATLNMPLDKRVSVWNKFLVRHRMNKYSKQVRAEVENLNKLKELVWLGKIEQKQRKLEARPKVEVAFVAPDKVQQGSPMTPVIAVVSDQPLAGVSFMWKKAKEPRYHLAQMQPSGDSSYTATLPASAVETGTLDFFIKATDSRGKALSLAGTAGAPKEVVVEQGHKVRQDRKGRSRASSRVEWVDFYLKEPGADAYWNTEADYAYRLKFKFLHSFRMGFGMYQGQGGVTECIENPEACTDTGKVKLAVGYAFFEPELRLSDKVHILPRLVVGTIQEKQDPFSSDRRLGDAMVGFHAYLRVGDEEGTHLLAGGSATEELGTEALLAMNFAVFERVPIGISAMATNFPVNEDYAARLLARVGFKPADWIALETYFGVNMRNIRHLGIGAGAGVTLNW
jgi:hypothetical protein